ncbi:MAG: secretin N-terminal domain-containing protein [Planctomycetota bacterium]|jgi:type II secretory pathway component GspD/PulD (secretin)
MAPRLIRSGRIREILVVCLTLAGAGAPTRAQEGDVGVSTLAGQVELPRLIDLCAERLGLKIEYDPKALQGASVTLRLRDGIADDELWMVTNQLLTSRGFAAVQMPGSELISVTKLSDAQRLARLEDRPDEAQAGYVTLLYELRHRTVKEVTDAIRPLLSKPGGAIAALGNTKIVLLSDYKPRVEQAVHLIERIDVPPAAATVETIPLENLAASQLTGLINAAATAFGAVSGTQLKGKLIPVPGGNAVVLVAPQDEAAHWREMLERFDRRQALQTRSYVPRHFAVNEVASLIEEVGRDPSPRGSGAQWRVVTDALTGTLIVTATPSEHEQMGALIERLDAVPVAARRPVRAYPIRNRSVNEILDVLVRLVEAGVLEGTEVEPAGAEQRPAARQRTEREVLPPGAEPVLPPAARPEPDRDQQRSRYPAGFTGGKDEEVPLTLTADQGTNTLIAVGEARRLNQVAELIRTLDVRQPQVMLEVLATILTEGDTFDLGVELEKMEISGSTLINLASLFGLGAAGLEEVETPTGAGGTALVLRPGDFRVLVRALETINDGRSLNIPKVLVSNNQQAVLDSVLQQPFTSTNASDTVATTSFGGTQDAGTSVTVRPQIAEGDHLLLEYSVSLSTFVGESSDPALPPPRQQNNLQSVVTIPDGYTVVVGGLETVTEAEAVSQVPLLGSIPILGEVFKSRSISSTRNRFYVFIRVNILRHGGFEDLKYLSDRDVVAAEIDDEWPEVEPRVIR